MVRESLPRIPSVPSPPRVPIAQSADWRSGQEGDHPRQASTPILQIQ